MERPLAGRLILIVEDEPLIAMSIETSFEQAGATVAKATTLRHAFTLLENDQLSAAVIDHALGDGDSTQLCERLKKRDIPFVLHTGYSKLEGACNAGVVLGKPTAPEVIVTKVVGLLSSRQTLN
jgi:DNA-binding response OmpR family regulator